MFQNFLLLFLRLYEGVLEEKRFLLIEKQGWMRVFRSSSLYVIYGQNKKSSSCSCDSSPFIAMTILSQS